MNHRLPITILIAAKNEEGNIARCLSALSPAACSIVIDSHSQDATERIAREQGAEVVQFQYSGGYTKKRQWAMNTLCISTPWILLLDADEVIPEPLWKEIGDAINGADPCEGYLITKGFHFFGRRFRFGGFSHSALMLFRTGKARFERIIPDSRDGLDMEVHERLLVQGRIGRMKTALIHEDFKGLEAYIDRHNRYSTWEARVRHHFSKNGNWGRETIKPRFFGNTQERRRFLKGLAICLPFERLLWFLYHYVFRLGFLEGRPGLIASQIRARYIGEVRAKLYELSREIK
ncbi:MAG: glycosyltransferase family 2 protein [Deltaproteobacteria bacterium]|nr:glycosyltransferase family 2 protein [Deltaproteobacteria bacterium]